MIFGRSQKKNQADATLGLNEANGAQPAYPQQAYPAGAGTNGYGTPGGTGANGYGANAGTNGYGAPAGTNGYGVPAGQNPAWPQGSAGASGTYGAQGGSYFQGGAPAGGSGAYPAAGAYGVSGYAGQPQGQNASGGYTGFASGAYPQTGAPYARQSTGGQAQAGYGQNGQAPYAPVFGAQGQSGAYAPQSSYAQGYAQVPQGAAQPPQGYPQASQGYAQVPQGYPQSFQGYPQGSQGYSAYGQMGRQGSPAASQQPAPGRQIPINGGGYVPPQVQVRKAPLAFSDTLLILLSVVLLALLIVGVAAKLPVLLWIYVAMAVISIAYFWIRPVIASNKRLCFSVVFGVLIAVAVVSALPKSTGSSGNGAAVAGTQTTAPPAQSGAVIDSRTGESLETVENLTMTSTPAPEQDDTATTDRLESFFYYWSVNKHDEMLSLCSPTWLSSVDNPKTALFYLVATRVPLDYMVEKVSGTVDDTSRTVTVASTMDRNNGKEPVKYRLSVLMVKEGGEWYVDPQSLKTYENTETQDPATAATPTPTAEPAVLPETVLYYNPDGGTKYHLDQNCKSTHAKFLPFKGHFTYAEVNDPAYANLSPCNVCAAPLR